MNSFQLRLACIMISVFALSLFNAAAEAAQDSVPAPTATTQAPATGGFFHSLNPGLVGGLAGAGVGVLGGLLGTVGGICAPQGRAKGFVQFLFALMIAVGLALLALGVGALIAKAPWMIGYGFLMPGVLATVLGVTLYPVMLARYRQAEMRRLEAESFRTG